MAGLARLLICNAQRLLFGGGKAGGVITGSGFDEQLLRAITVRVKTADDASKVNAGRGGALVVEPLGGIATYLACPVRLLAG